MIQNENIYVLETGNPDNPSSWWTGIEEHNSLDPYEFIRGKTDSLQGARFIDLKGRRKQVDGITNSLLLPIVSNKVVEILEAHCFRGWSTIPIELHKKDKKISGFHCLQVPSQCGALNKSKAYQTEIDWPLSPTGKRTVTKGYCIETDECGDNDFFIPEGTTFILCNQRVFEALSEAQLVDIELTPLSEILVN